eukprot:68962-Chlamydomonas_euryale.AAC.2
MPGVYRLVIWCRRFQSTGICVGAMRAPACGSGADVNVFGRGNVAGFCGQKSLARVTTRGRWHMPVGSGSD